MRKILVVLIFTLFLNGCADDSTKQFLVIFESNGGSEVLDINVDSNSSFIEPIPPSKDDSKFLGWFSDSNFNHAYDFSQPVTGNLKLNAKWGNSNYQIKFLDYDNSVIYSEIIEYNTDLSNLSFPDDPVREGYTFSVWDIEIPNIMPENDVIIRAEYNIESYTFKYLDYDGTELYSAIIEYNTDLSSISIPEMTPRTGYTFYEWDFEIPNNMPANDVIITAMYNLKTYNLEFIDYDNSVIYSANIEYNTDLSNFSFPNDPLREGYTFNEWDIEIPNNMPNQNIIIMATYSINEYTITFVENGGTPITNMTLDFNSDLHMPNPIKPYFVFRGWYTNPELTQAFVVEEMPAYSVTLYAKWEVDHLVIGGNGSDELRSVIQDTDGNFIAVGVTASIDIDITDGNNGTKDALIIKFDSNGNIIWQESFGGSGMEVLVSVIQDSNGDFVAVGYSNSNDLEITDGNNGDVDALIIKFDSDGNVIWNKTFGGSGLDELRSVIQDTDGNFIAVGVTISSDIDITDGNNGSTDALIVKFDSDGNVLWNKTFGGSGVDELLSVTQDADDNFIAVGVTGSNDIDITDGNNGYADALIVKFNANGIILWHKTFGGSVEEGLSSVIQDTDGNFIAVGITTSNDIDITDGNNGDEDALIVKFDSNGIILWNKTFGGGDSDILNTVIQDSNGDFIAVGYTWSSNYDITDGNYGFEDALMIKFDSDGYILTHKTFGGQINDFIYSVIQDSDGSFVTVGATWSYDGDITDDTYFWDDGLVWFVRV